MARPYGTYNNTDDPPPPDPEIDCQGEGGPDCKCETCKTYCCPNCHTCLYKPWAQYYNCPECGTIMDSYDQDGGLR